MILCILFVFKSCLSTKRNLLLWHKVQIYKVTISSTLLQSSVDRIERFFLKSASHADSRLVCEEGTGGVISIYNSIVNINYMSNFYFVDEQQLTCYTTRPYNLVVGSEVTYKTPVIQDVRFGENLIDGFYGFDINECYGNNWHWPNGWIMFNLTTPQNIKQIAFFNQPSGKFSTRNRAVTVYASNVPPNTPGDFSNFDKVDGPLKVNNFENELAVINTDITVQYVAFQDSKILHICHLDLFAEKYY